MEKNMPLNQIQEIIKTYSEETFKRKNLIYICRKMKEFYQRKAEEELLRLGETSDD